MISRRAVIAVASYALVAAACFAAVRLFAPVRVAGGSMHPALHTGDLVFVSRGTEPSRGDIVLFRAPGHGPVLHRVVAVEANGSVRTQGDANQIPDLEPVAKEYVTGTVVAVVPVGAAIERWRRN